MNKQMEMTPEVIEQLHWALEEARMHNERLLRTTDSTNKAEIAELSLRLTQISAMHQTVMAFDQAPK